MNGSLRGRKIAILVESQYIPEEIRVYRAKFQELGAEVHFMARLWGNQKLVFVGEVEEPDQTPETLEVSIDLEHVNVGDYDAVIMSAS